MPRGMNPNSQTNLISNSERTPKERQEQAKKAGIASGKVRAAIKPLRELLKEQCSEEDRRQINENLIRMAKRNIRAYELLMKALGEDPAQKLELTGADGGPLEFTWLEENSEGEGG